MSETEEWAGGELAKASLGLGVTGAYSREVPQPRWLPIRVCRAYLAGASVVYERESDDRHTEQRGLALMPGGRRASNPVVGEDN